MTMTLIDILESFDVPLATRTLILEGALGVFLFERKTTDPEAIDRGLGDDLREAAIVWYAGEVQISAPPPPVLPQPGLPGFLIPGPIRLTRITQFVWRMGATYPGLRTSFTDIAEVFGPPGLLRAKKWPREGSFFSLTPGAHLATGGGYRKVGWEGPWVPAEPPLGFPDPPPSVRASGKPPRGSRAAARRLVATQPIGACVSCRFPVHAASFRDTLSRKEWEISKLCQDCQDAVFTPDELADE